VTVTVSRYDHQLSTRVTRLGRGEGRRVENPRKAPMEGINVNTYEVDPKAVADAILRRLLAGGSIKAN
jgi:hypothetical protein